MAVYNTTYSFSEIERVAATGSRVFFLGICGSGMSALAELMSDMGYEIIGADRAADCEWERRFASRGIALASSSDDVSGCSALVYTNAVQEGDIYLKCARDRGIMCISRANMLGYIASKYRRTLAVCGVHGKSTTSAMLYCIMAVARSGVSLQSGAAMRVLSPVRNEGSERECMVVEACEYMRSFMCISPSVAVVLSLEHEHTDCYPRYEDIESAFRSFLSEKGIERIILNYDDANLRRIMPQLPTESCTYSLVSRECDLYAESISYSQGICTFEVFYRGKHMGTATLRLMGRYNVQNALAAMLCALEEGVPFSQAVEALATFCGIERRMQWHLVYRGYDVYEDYAHHPSKIRASLVAMREAGYERIVCVFQPHTYSRLNTFFDGMAAALALADTVILADVYSAREVQGDRRGSRELAQEIGALCIYAGDREGALAATRALSEADGTRSAIVVMGAGDIGTIISRLAK